jgi:hypothetical protein
MRIGWALRKVGSTSGRAGKVDARTPRAARPRRIQLAAIAFVAGGVVEGEPGAATAVAASVTACSVLDLG